MTGTREKKRQTAPWSEAIAIAPAPASVEQCSGGEGRREAEDEDDDTLNAEREPPEAECTGADWTRRQVCAHRRLVEVVCVVLRAGAVVSKARRFLRLKVGWAIFLKSRRALRIFLDFPRPGRIPRSPHRLWTRDTFSPVLP